MKYEVTVDGPGDYFFYDTAISMRQNGQLIRGLYNHKVSMVVRDNGDNLLEVTTLFPLSTEEFEKNRLQYVKKRVHDLNHLIKIRTSQIHDKSVGEDQKRECLKMIETLRKELIFWSSTMNTDCSAYNFPKEMELNGEY